MANLRILLILIVLLSQLTVLHGQPSTKGFISIDCGIAANSSYVDSITKLTYESDEKYIDTGNISKVAANYLSGASYQARTVRSFPAGDKNCYMLRNLTINVKYFIRTTFLYGNYDGLRSVKPNNPLLFDLYIGVDKWATVNISDASKEYTFDIVTLTTLDFTWICLLNTKSGTPFISAIELRPVKVTMYQDVRSNQSNALVLRYNYGPTTNQIIRYPDDPYDRIWLPFSYDTDVFEEISYMNASIETYSDDAFEIPFEVLRTAITPINSMNLTIITNLERPNDPNFLGYYTCLCFAELQVLQSTDLIEFAIYDENNELWSETIEPPYRMAYFDYASAPEIYTHYDFLLAGTMNSTLPPFINAIEIYLPLPLTNLMTNVQDVNALYSIKRQYGLKGKWSGDPCVPSQYIWTGLRCSGSIYSQPRIIFLNLSSSNLTGAISYYFSMISELHSLDLSCNSLTGEIPDSLTDLLSLQVLNLSGNNFTGSVPDKLKTRANAGLLTLITGQGSCSQDYPPSDPVKVYPPSPVKKKTIRVIILSVAIPVFALMLVGLVLHFILCRKVQQGPSVPQVDEPKIGTEFHRFTYAQLSTITKQFAQVVGRGGFGTVYLGIIDNKREVAVKISQAPSDLTTRQFLSEVEILSHVHHRNLVSLVGYCMDGDKLGIVYEYISQGSLSDHIRGKAGIVKPLNWADRVRISLEAAQGLEYLHTGCRIIHRDVKSDNILLDQNLTAKVADFGFSKIIAGNSSIFTSLYICGTPGYIDPEANLEQKLTEKSDVYSFGVILWEIITGEPAIIQGEVGQANINIVDLVRQRLPRACIEAIADRNLRQDFNLNSISDVVDLANRCDDLVRQRLSRACMEEIADRNLRQDFNLNSIWHVVDLANRCTGHSSQRPTMAKVVVVLKEESLALEAMGTIQRGGSSQEQASNNSSNMNSSPEISQPSNNSGNNISSTDFLPTSR